MKRIIIAILMVFISISYADAGQTQNVEFAKDKKSTPLKGYLPLPAQYKYYFFKKGMSKETEKADFLDCIEGQRRIISFGRMNTAGDQETKSYQGYHGTVWVTIQCMKNKGYIETKHESFEYP